jgi:hypothetical protein
VVVVISAPSKNISQEKPRVSEAVKTLLSVTLIINNFRINIVEPVPGPKVILGAD